MDAVLATRREPPKSGADRNITAPAQPHNNFLERPFPPPWGGCPERDSSRAVSPPAFPGAIGHFPIDAAAPGRYDGFLLEEMISMLWK